jgi:hypothetical protein
MRCRATVVATLTEEGEETGSNFWAIAAIT